MLLGWIVISVWLATGQWDYIRTISNGTGQIARRSHREGVASVFHNTWGRYGNEPGWRQEDRPWFSAVAGFVTHGSFLFHSIKILWCLSCIYTCTRAYWYFRLLIKSIIIPLEHDRYSIILWCLTHWGRGWVTHTCVSNLTIIWLR